MMEITGGWKNCVMRSFIIYTLHQILDITKVIKAKQDDVVGHVARMGEMRTGYQILFKKQMEETIWES
jgi:hypothetical protein